MTELRGITWSHSRGYVPLVAASEAWHDLRPNVSIRWDKRSLWGFGEGPLDEVARTYDLVVFDHPFTGRAARRQLFLPLNRELPNALLAELESDSVGSSYGSYAFDGDQYGLPLDAACQSAAYRPDLLAARDEAVPATWLDVLGLARRTAAVRCSFSPMGAVGMFHSLCASLGAPPGRTQDCYVTSEIAKCALSDLRLLFEATACEGLEASPVRILGEMTRGDEILYAPMVYCYSNYCRAGYANRPLRFSPAPLPGTGHPVLGGAGLAVSRFTQSRDAALEFAAWLSGPECQSSLYLLAGGQPASRAAWTSNLARVVAGEFFRDLLPSIERAYIRPTYDGFTDFQTALGAVLHAFLRGLIDVTEAVSAIDRRFIYSCTGVEPCASAR